MIIYDKSLMTEAAVVGGKSIGLAKLVAYGLKVPDFFVVASGTDINDAGFAAELDGFAANLHCDLFAVRSSSLNEDSENGSFAGQFSTQLNVSRDKLLQAVKNVVASCGNKHATEYSEHFNIFSGGVAVVVQKQLHGDYSGVMFTTSPFNSKETIIEIVAGTGESLVGGTATPEESRAFKKGEPCNDRMYNCLLSAADKLEKNEGCPLDIEWTSCKNEVYFLQMRPMTAVGDSLPLINDRKWDMYVYRDFCLFAHGVQRIASYPHIQEKQFGFSVPIAEGLIVNGREFYSPENDVKVNAIWNNLNKGSFFSDFIKNIKKCVSITRSRTNRLKNIDCANMNAHQLFSLYKREIKAYVKSYVPMMLRPDEYLYEKLINLVGESRAEEIAAAAAISNRRTYYSSERSKFLSALICGDITAYLDCYEWIGSPLGKKCVTVDKQYFLKRAEGLTPSAASEKLKEISVLHKKDMAHRKKVFAELNGEEAELFNLISEFIYLRTYTAENSDRYFYYIRKNIFENLAKLIRIDMDILLLMSPEEVEMAENGFRLSAREIAKRKSGEVVVISDGISSVYYTGRSYSMLKNLLQTRDGDGSTVLEGRIACMGEVCGKVKIVNDIQQAENFEEGCILVTTMTVPEITSAIDKAIGIITDEGGITCHAAIIAREYSVPCLVGTKIATSVLKDGAYVKLDCINGRVVLL